MQAELIALRGQYPVLDLMLASGEPVTRESYILLNWAGEVKEPLDAEQEASLPPPLQKWVEPADEDGDEA